MLSFHFSLSTYQFPKYIVYINQIQIETNNHVLLQSNMLFTALPATISSSRNRLTSVSAVLLWPPTHYYSHCALPQHFFSTTSNWNVYISLNIRFNPTIFDVYLDRILYLWLMNMNGQFVDGIFMKNSLARTFLCFFLQNPHLTRYNLLHVSQIKTGCTRHVLLSFLSF